MASPFGPQSKISYGRFKSGRPSSCLLLMLINSSKYFQNSKIILWL